MIALASAGFTLRMWRDHQTLTARKGVQALQKKINEGLDEYESRWQTIRREFAGLQSDVSDALEQVGRKAHRATMRERRAVEVEQAAAQPAAPSWQEVRKARIRAASGV